jgi:hypothetical protein
MHRGGLAKVVGVGLILALGASSATRASAAPPTRSVGEAESVELGTKLARGQSVTYPQELEAGEEHYVGGVTYTIIPADMSELPRLLGDVNVYTRVLPATQSAKLVEVRGSDFWVELRQGNGVLSSTITLVFRPDADGKTVRFWLDLTRPHDVRDAWGFLRAVPLDDGAEGPRFLLTYGALLDVGPGFVRTFFEGKLRQLLLSVPQRIRAFENDRRQALLRQGAST